MIAEIPPLIRVESTEFMLIKANGFDKPESNTANTLKGSMACHKSLYNLF